MAKIPLKLEFVETTEQTHLTADGQLTTELRRLLADTFIFYLLAHGFHWNVEGSNFGPFHTLFETIYSEVYGTVDTMAEHLRKLGAPAPAHPLLYQEERTIPDVEYPALNDPLRMVEILLDANAALMTQIRVVYRLAETQHLTYLQNYLDERTDAHQKHAWFLRATLAS
jgi:starvation-inducible DNA-binding protein